MHLGDRGASGFDLGLPDPGAGRGIWDGDGEKVDLTRPKHSLCLQAYHVSPSCNALRKRGERNGDTAHTLTPARKPSDFCIIKAFARRTFRSLFDVNYYHLIQSNIGLKMINVTSIWDSLATFTSLLVLISTCGKV